MILHLVTDRRRLAHAGSTAGRERCLMRQVEYAVEAGIDVVQIREPDLEAGALASLVREAVARARGTTTRIVVNDRVDVAIACGAGGVHLRGSSMSAALVRAVVGREVAAPFLIGRSVHSEADARAAAPGADYLIAGTLWPTASKPEPHPLLGVDGLMAIAAAVDLPVLAIGGVTSSRAAALAAAGAAGIAGIGLFMTPDEGGCRAVPLQETVAALRRS